jgi:hypothetical protein
LVCRPQAAAHSMREEYGNLGAWPSVAANESRIN